MRFQDYFFKQSPYEGFDIESVPADTQGWGSKAAVFAKLLDELKPEKIVEVGTWKGASAIHMAQICRDQEIETDILCVDTFLGASGLYLRQGFAEEMLKMKNGMPTIYQTFLRNVIEADLTDVITPLPLPSREAAVVLVKRRVRADLIYIDGDHSYEGCLEDLTAFRQVLAPGGLMLADDKSFPGVAQALDEFSAETGAKMIPTSNKVILSFDRDVSGLEAWAEDVRERQARHQAQKAAQAEQG
jgi:predicted O-methyltransferase YrrM